jgi:hypothetical protein
MYNPIFSYKGGVFYLNDIFIYKNNIMKKTIRLTESDLMRIVKRTIREMEEYTPDFDIESVDCGSSSRGGELDGTVDIDDDGKIVIKYCKGDKETLEYLKEKGRRLFYNRYKLQDEYGDFNLKLKSRMNKF